MTMIVVIIITFVILGPTEETWSGPANTNNLPLGTGPSGPAALPKQLILRMIIIIIMIIMMMIITCLIVTMLMMMIIIIIIMIIMMIIMMIT